MDKLYESKVDQSNTTKVELLTGLDVLELLYNKSFESGWDDLYEACSWKTVFQSRSFVTEWYRVYQHEYLPIIVRSSKGGRINGLLPMTLHLSGVNSLKLEHSRGNIIGAGHYDAEYQVWLSDESEGNFFIEHALQVIRSQFPNCNIHFRFLPQNTPLLWIKNNTLRKDLILQAIKRPLMDLKDPGLPKLFRKNEFRNKLNRLKKLGELKLIHVKDMSAFSKVLQQATVQFDFRQGAMFDKNQFRDNPFKSDFLISLFKQDLLHVTVLTVEDEVIATIMAIADTHWIHLGGINVHTPFYADYYSPGFVHFVMLGQLLAQEGFEIFDLTPGGDSYKERLANRHDQVYELIITGTLVFKFKRHLRKLFHEQVIKAGLRPMSVELSIKRMIYLLKNKITTIRRRPNLSSLLADLKYKVQPEKIEVLLLDGSDFSPSKLPAIEKNNLADLLQYEQSGSWQTRWEFLQQAMHRYEIGEQSYSWAEQGRLLGCVWVVQKGKSYPLPFSIPEGAAVLQGLYCHTLGKAQVKAFLAAVAHIVRDASGAIEVFLVTDSRQRNLLKLM